MKRLQGSLWYVPRPTAATGLRRIIVAYLRNPSFSPESNAQSRKAALRQIQPDKQPVTTCRNSRSLHTLYMLIIYIND